MSVEDALRWNKRYDEAPPGWYDAPRSFLIEHLDLLPTTGLALDLAMGVGQNAAVLAARGMTVIGLDISSTAAFQARRRSTRIFPVVADLQDGYLPAAHFDVALNFYFLQREIFARLPAVLKPGGLAIVETLTRPMLGIKPDLEPAYLLETGELPRLFTGWEILIYREGWVTSDHGRQKSIASLIARRPAEMKEKYG